MARERRPRWAVAWTLGAALAAALAASPALVPPAAARPSDEPGFQVLTTGRAVSPGRLATHTLVISSSSASRETIALEVTGQLWAVDVPPTVVVPARGQAAAIVSVTIPATVPSRAFDTATVVARSMRSGVVQTVDLTTRTGGDFDGRRYVGCRFDFDRDGAIGGDDAAIVAGLQSTDVVTGPDALYDLDGSGRIDAGDIDLISTHLGQMCRELPTVDSSALRAGLSAEGLREDLLGLQRVAAAHGGNRAIDGSGYEASVVYVEQALERMGLASRRSAVPYPFFRVLSPAVAEQVAPEAKVYGVDAVRLFQYSGSGDVTAELEAVDLQLPPGATTDSSTSGCEDADFDEFEPGGIALLQRGTCSYGRKVALAEAAGAAAAIVFNEGQPQRREVVSSALDGPGALIPAFSASFDVGAGWAAQLAQGQPVTLHLAASTEAGYREAATVIADRPGRVGDDVLVLGAHLDSVPAGPGINDNGSGVAALLGIAREMNRLAITTTNTVRFAFWAAEEIGLVGSNHYVAGLDVEARREIIAYLNLDMIGSPNWGRFVYEGDEIDGPGRRPEGSAEIEAVFLAHFAGVGLPTLPVVIDGRSDHGAFAFAGIPVGGLFTGTGEHKTEAEVALFGGQAGHPHDPCYHQPCDTVDNIAWAVCEELADAAAHAALAYAVDGSFAYRHAAEAPRSMFLPVLGVGVW